jgi:ComF family protein
MKIQALITPVLDTVFPRKCLGCGTHASDPGSFSGLLCNECMESIYDEQQAHCPVCQAPVPSLDFVTESSCFCCEHRDVVLSGIMTIGRYDHTELLGRMILQMKHGGEPYLKHVFSALLYRRIMQRMPGTTFDGVVAVPLHFTRSWKRGYNQAGLIAEELANRLKTPYFGWLLKRDRRTAVQGGGPEQRQRNIRGAFRADGYCMHARLLLVDDVFTTGATSRECIKMLVKAGAKSVSLATCAWVSKGMLTGGKDDSSGPKIL